MEAKYYLLVDILIIIVILRLVANTELKEKMKSINKKSKTKKIDKKRWYYKVKNEIYGPIDTEELVSALIMNETLKVLSEETLIKEENNEHWQKVKENNYLSNLIKNINSQKKSEKELKKKIYKEMLLLEKIERS